MNSSKSIITAALVAAGIGQAVTACGGAASTTAAPAATTPASASTPATHPSAAATPINAMTTPAAAAAASPVGTWNVAYAADPTSILGQYVITQDASAYAMTTGTVLRVPDGHCSLPPGTEVGTFSASGAPGNYLGTERLYEVGTCAPAGTDATLDVTTTSGDTLMLLVPSQQTVTLTRVSGAASAPPAATAPASPAASPADCVVPNYIGAGSNGHLPAAAAVADVHNASYYAGGVLTSCDWNVKIVDSVPGPLYKEVPAPGTVVPPGGTVTLYF